MSDPHPEAGIFRSQTTQNSGPEDGFDSNTILEDSEQCANSSGFKQIQSLKISPLWSSTRLRTKTC